MVRLPVDACLAITGTDQTLDAFEKELGTYLRRRLRTRYDGQVLLQRFADRTLHLAVSADRFVATLGPCLDLEFRAGDGARYRLRWTVVGPSEQCRIRLPDLPGSEKRPLRIRVSDADGRAVDRFKLQIQAEESAARVRAEATGGRARAWITLTPPPIRKDLSGQAGVVRVDDIPLEASLRLRVVDIATRRWAARTLVHRGDPVDIVLDRGLLRAVGEVLVDGSLPLPREVDLSLGWLADESISGMRPIMRDDPDMHTFTGVTVDSSGRFEIELPERIASFGEIPPAISVRLHATGFGSISTTLDPVEIEDPVALGSFPLERNPPVLRIASAGDIDADRLQGAWLRAGGFEDPIDWVVDTAEAWPDGSIALYLFCTGIRDPDQRHIAWNRRRHEQVRKTFPTPTPDFLYFQPHDGQRCWLAREGLETWRVVQASEVELVFVPPAGFTGADATLSLDWHGSPFELARLHIATDDRVHVSLTVPDPTTKIRWTLDGAHAKGGEVLLEPGSMQREIPIYRDRDDR